jgi:hypothetical protein
VGVSEVSDGTDEAAVSVVIAPGRWEKRYSRANQADEATKNPIKIPTRYGLRLLTAAPPHEPRPVVKALFR